MSRISSRLTAYSGPALTADACFRSVILLLGGSALALGFSTTTSAASAGATAQLEEVRPLRVNGADYLAARSTISESIRTQGAAKPEGGRYAPLTLKSVGAAPLAIVDHGGMSAQMPGFVGEVYPTAPGFPPGSFYPYDVNLFDVNTGAIKTLAQSSVVKRAEFHNIYINQTPDHWGNPSIFQTNLFESDFIHLVDQYVHANEDARYSLGASALVNYPVSSTPLSDTGDISAIVHAAAKNFGSGYGHVYNVFLPKGVDVCLTPTVCYSPDNFAAWIFCGYHNSVQFADIGLVLYIVTPYPDAFGISNGAPFYACDVGQANPTVNTAPTPNGVLVDSMSSIISHETFETITDAIPENGWWVYNSANNDEIGDLCVNNYFLYVPFNVSGTLYYIQPEYSNKYHACVTVP
jgi:hypothetical protein